MRSILRGRMRASQLLSEAEFERMRQHGEVLEQDTRGIKVIRLADGNMLKIFYVTRLFSSARLYSYARRFYRNAIRLQQLGIPTVQVSQLLHFANSSNTAVLYQPLPGQTLKQLLFFDDGITAEIAAGAGKFIARLHHLGIYFRSLHFGNIVLKPDGEFGLIDIADMSISRKSLRWSKRRRNFRHLHRYADDIEKLGVDAWHVFLQNYSSESEQLDNFFST